MGAFAPVRLSNDKALAFRDYIVCAAVRVAHAVDAIESPVVHCFVWRCELATVAGSCLG